VESLALPLRRVMCESCAVGELNVTDSEKGRATAPDPGVQLKAKTSTGQDMPMPTHCVRKLARSLEQQLTDGMAGDFHQLFRMPDSEVRVPDWLTS
jgi:hypothetical protein